MACQANFFFIMWPLKTFEFQTPDLQRMQHMLTGYFLVKDCQCAMQNYFYIFCQN